MAVSLHEQTPTLQVAEKMWRHFRIEVPSRVLSICILFICPPPPLYPIILSLLLILIRIIVIVIAITGNDADPGGHQPRGFKGPKPPLTCSRAWT